MKLEKCALCGKPQLLVGKDYLDASQHERGCPLAPFMELVRVADWNRLQRAIRKLRKSEPAGRVLAREWWCPCCQQVALEEDKQGRTCVYHDVPMVRVEVREVKGGGV